MRFLSFNNYKIKFLNFYIIKKWNFYSIIKINNFKVLIENSRIIKGLKVRVRDFNNCEY